jgi:hypothetical protein
MTMARNPYKWGATDYLRSFEIGEVREFTEDFNWRYLQSIACRLENDWGCEFNFYTDVKTKQKLIRRKK